jgi:hypothetical protein
VFGSEYVAVVAKRWLDEYATSIINHNNMGAYFVN